MPVKTFRIEELEMLWDEYNERRQIRALVGGKWVYTDGGIDKVKGMGATRAEVVKLKDHKTFIEFLKEL